MDSNTPQLCRLCLENSEASVNIFENFEGTTIASILTQHFWFQVHEDDGFSEHLCKICWTNTKMFHYFYRKVEFIQKNYWETINLIKTDIDVVEQDQSVSPNGTVMEIDLPIIKCEETEQVTDLQINIAESSHHNENNFQTINLIKTDIDVLEQDQSVSPNGTVMEIDLPIIKCEETEQVTDLQINIAESSHHNENNFQTINLIKTDIDVVEHDQSVSPKGTVMEIDLSIIKCEEYVTDLQINIAESSRHNGNNFHLNNSVDCGNKHILDDEGEFSKTKQNKSLRSSSKNVSAGTDSSEEIEHFVESPQSSQLQSKTSRCKEHIVKEDAQISEFFTIKCEICHDRLDTFAKVRKHYRAVHNTEGYLICCGKKISRRYLALDHIHLHLNPGAFRCDPCGKNFSDRRSLRSHIANHESIDSRIHKCNLCSKRFAKPFKLTQHELLRHSSEDEKKFHCDICNKRYVLKSLLKDHIRRYHVLAFKQVCDICANVFKSKSALQYHMKQKHSTITRPKVQCTECGVWLKHESSLRAHMIQHKSKVATCRICNTVCKNTQLLRSHIHSVHSERSHQCLICNKAFKKSRALKEHMALHTGQDLYKCKYCTKTFKSGANRYSHQKKAHFTEWTKDRSKRLTATSVE